MQNKKQQESPSPSYAALQINEDLPFKRKEWAIERAGWVFMTLLIIAAFAGLFSNGPLSSMIVTDSTATLRIEYERFHRLQTASTINIEVLPVGETGRVILLLEGDIIHKMDIENIRPEPAEATLTKEGWALEFEASSLPSSILMSVTPEKSGFITGRIGLEGRDSNTVSIFVYP